MLAHLLSEEVGTSNSPGGHHGSAEQPNGCFVLRTDICSSSCENDAALAALLNEEFLVDTDDALSKMKIQNRNLQRLQVLEHQPPQLTQQLPSQNDGPTSSTRCQCASENECGICMDSFANACLVPCGHTNFCMQCAKQLQVCAICRTPIQEV